MTDRSNDSGGGSSRAGSDPIEVSGGASSCREDPTYPTGSLVGSYWIEGILGSGGTACVYKAKHAKIGRRVALKALRGRFTENREVVERFFAEARTANRVDHENIVQVTDLVEDHDSGTHYFVMELLEGFDLRELIELEGALEPERAVRIAVQIADALVAAHQAGVVHRDLKPENIYLVESARRDDFVKILDFGVAKLAAGIAELSRAMSQSDVHTSPGTLVGTPAYMSPEQLSGKPVDFHTDLYSFGLVLYEMLAGWPPFVADGFADLVVAHKTEIPKPPSSLLAGPADLPAELEELVLWCLEKRQDDRPDSMAVVLETLVAIASREGWALESTVPPPTPPPAAEGQRDSTLRMLRPDLVAATRPRADDDTVERIRPDLVEAIRRGTPAPVPVEDAERERGAGPAGHQAPEPPRRRRRWLAALLAAVLLGGGATLAASLAARDGGEPSAPVPAEAPPVVTVSFSSTPPGAAVYRDGEAGSLGTTPFERVLDRGAAEVTFEFRMAGHEAVRRGVRLEDDAVLAVVLEPAAEGQVESDERLPDAGVPPARAAGRPGHGRGGRPERPRPPSDEAGAGRPRPAVVDTVDLDQLVDPYRK